MYNAGKVEALANLKTKTNAFLGTTTNKNGVTFSFWDKWGPRMWLFLPSLVLLLGPASGHHVKRRRSPRQSHAQTHWKKAARTATVLREEPDNAAKSNGLGRSESKKCTRQTGRADDSLHSTGID